MSSRSSLEVHLSDCGEIRTPAVHDANIYGIETTEDGSAVVFLRLTNRSKIILKMDCVERMRVDDFCEGNIVLDITVAKGDQITIDEIEHLYRVNKKNRFCADDIVERLRSKGMLVVTINPSYGCFLTATCRDISMGEL